MPHANAVWVYDPMDANGHLEAGYFVGAINNYNVLANSGHTIREIYSYGGDMEMYCPGGIPANCTGSDLYVNYSRTQPVPGLKDSNADTYAYHQGVRSDLIGGSPYIVPIIDGAVYGSGHLSGFNDLSPTMARHFADKVTHRICDDPYAAGVQFDLEPFNVETKNAQYYFYLRIAYDFAHWRGCVNARYPQGRFFSIFSGNRAINPDSPSAARVAEILNSYHNGYMIDPLYDLSSEPSGYRTSNSDYIRLADIQTYNMVRWADRLGIRYQFAIPGAAGFHEYQSCNGPACAGAAEPQDGQLSYVMDGEHAIDASVAAADQLYLGTSVFCFSTHMRFGSTSFGPLTPSSSVENYIAGLL